jgi:hypothetical protein
MDICRASLSIHPEFGGAVTKRIIEFLGFQTFSIFLLIFPPQIINLNLLRIFRMRLAAFAKIY